MRASRDLREQDRLWSWEVVESSTSRSGVLAATLKPWQFMTCAARATYLSGAAECWSPESVVLTISRSRASPGFVFPETSRPALVTSREMSLCPKLLLTTMAQSKCLKGRDSDSRSIWITLLPRHRALNGSKRACQKPDL